MKYFVYNPKITITKQNVEEEKDRQNIDINKMMRLELLETKEENVGIYRRYIVYREGSHDIS